jgi:hypothetical protein
VHTQNEKRSISFKTVSEGLFQTPWCATVVEMATSKALRLVTKLREFLGSPDEDLAE